MTQSGREHPNILVITPHPDDAEGGAGGTIAKWAARGSWVGLVVCTNGDKGTSDREVRPEDLARTREREQMDAARVLGIQHVTFLRLPDQGLQDNDEFREKLVREIRTYRPEIVFTIDPNRPYTIHRDHRMTGRVALDAVFPYARDYLAYPQHLAQGLEPYKVREVYLWGSDQPDTFIDVTDTFDKKTEALFCHRSQMGDPSDGTRLSRMRQRHEEMGKHIGAPLAEAFKRIEIFR
ncbi:MAG: PIG-L family deacetylase [Chloroflexi bacterium]|nr:PIG-L family deacetylase [Chloroflexota bacterium]